MNGSNELTGDEGNEAMSKTFTNLFRSTILLAFVAVFSVPSAPAQGGFSSTSTSGRNKELGDGANFYMARRQYQVVDDSPIVKYGNGPAAAAGANGMGALPGGQAPLQRAGFMQYSSAMPTITAPLPKVNNGVPTPQNPLSSSSAGNKTSRAKAGSLSKGKKVSAPPTPVAAEPDGGIHAYNSYKGYNPSASLPVGAVPASAGSSMSSSGNVKGSVLHWSRRRRGQ